MEYNLDSVAPPQKLNPIKRFWNFVSSPQYSRTLGILTLLLIAAAIPLTLAQLKEPTSVTQQAALSCKATFTPTELGSQDIDANMTVEEESQNYQYVPVNSVTNGGQPNPSCGTSGQCGTNSECPQNTTSKYISTDQSNWCYNSFCLQLRWIGPASGTEAPTCTDKPESKSPALTPACFACIKDQGNKDFITRIKNQDQKFFGTCNDQEVLQYACNGALSAQAKTECDGHKTACGAACGINPTATPTPGGCPAYTIQGRVLNQQSNPVSGAIVCLDPNGDGTACLNNIQSAPSAADGNYTISVPAGTDIGNTVGHNIYVQKGDIVGGRVTNTVSNPIIPSNLCRNNIGHNLFVTVDRTGSPTATPTPTVTPTGSPTPTVTSTPTGTPPAGASTVNFSLTLTGIGPKIERGSQVAIWNTDPVKKTRDVTVYLYEADKDTTNDPNGDNAKYKARGMMEYDGNGKFVARDLILGTNITPGQYQVFVKTPLYLRKRIPGVQTIKVGGNQVTQQATLSIGDANDDNKLNIHDFETYRNCLNQQTAACIAKADFNDDGEIDRTLPTPKFLDHGLFSDQFAIINGD